MRLLVDPARHAADLHAANALDREGRNWTYLSYGLFDRLEDYRLWLDRASAGDDPLFHAIIERRSGRALGAPALCASIPQVASGSPE